jgi:hypothetical protein
MGILGIYASQISGHLVTNSYESISTVTVGAGGSSTVTFSSIPSTYKHLQIRGISRSTSAANSGDSLRMRFNSDNASNYSYHILDGYQGASGGIEAGSATSTTFASLFVQSENGHASNLFAAGIIDVLDYQNTNKYKTIRAIGGYDINGSTGGYNYVGIYSANWRSTSAVTDITLLCTGGNFAQYSSFALYGIRG